jgi:hypothetical protein
MTRTLFIERFERASRLIIKAFTAQPMTNMKAIHALFAATLVSTALTAPAFANDGDRRSPFPGTRSRHAPQLLYESAKLGPTNQEGNGVVINVSQYIGVRFEVHRDAKITGVGGHVTAAPPLFANTFYATIVRLPHASAFPAGHPFDASEVVASVLCTPNSEFSRDYIFPMKAKLPPGHYALIFGGGGTNAIMPGNNEPVPDTSFIVWDVNGWVEGSGLEATRFTLYGTTKR